MIPGYRENTSIQNAQLPIVKAGGTNTYHKALRMDKYFAVCRINKMYIGEITGSRDVVYEDDR